MSRLDNPQLGDFTRHIVIKVPKINISVVTVYFQAGSRFDPKGKEGLAHLCEHLFLTKNVGKTIFPKYMEGKGYRFSAFTDRELSSFSAFCKPGKEILVLQELLNLLSELQIDSLALKKEKQVILDEIYRDHSASSLVVNQNIWPDSSLARPLLGNKNTLTAITADDAHQFIKQRYTSAYATVVILSPQTISSNLIKRKLESLHKHPLPVHASERFGSIVRKKNIKSSKPGNKVYISYRLEENLLYQKSYLLFLNHILTNSWLGKLNTALRLNNSLTYYVDGRVSCYNDTGKLTLSYSIANKHLSTSLQLIHDEVNKMFSKPINSKALDKYKKSMLTRELISFSNLYYLSRYYAQFALRSAKILKTHNSFMESIEAITPDDILDLSQKVFRKDNQSTLIFGKN